MRKAAAISTGLHAAVLLWAVVSFSGKTFEVTPAESLPVDLINDKDFSELTKGAKDGAQGREAEAAGREDRRAEAGRRRRRPRSPRRRRSRPTAEKTPEPAPQPKPDPIAEKLKKTDEPKQEAKAEPQPLPPKKPPQKQQPKFDADKIAALLDKRDPQRNAATGAELNDKPSLGAAVGDCGATVASARSTRFGGAWPHAGTRRSAATARRNWSWSSACSFKRDGTL